MMYVTRSSLTKSITQVSAGLESVKQALQQRVDLVKAKLGGQLDELRVKIPDWPSDASVAPDSSLGSAVQIVLVPFCICLLGQDCCELLCQGVLRMGAVAASTSCELL